MTKRYVVIEQDKMPKIYDNWPECKEYVNGRKGIKYKSCKNNEEIFEFLTNELKDKSQLQIKNILENLNIEIEGIDLDDDIVDVIPTHITSKKPKAIEDIEIVSYVDGSYEEKTGDYGYGACIVKNNKVIEELYGVGQDNDNMRQIMGELEGALKVVEYAIENRYKEICICYDYKGIEKWAKQEWKTNKDNTTLYKEKMSKYSNYIDIYFKKVKAHSGIEFNEVADKLAKKGAKLNLLEKYIIVENNEFKTIVDTQEELNNLIQDNKIVVSDKCETVEDMVVFLENNINHTSDIVDLLGMYGIDLSSEKMKKINESIRINKNSIHIYISGHYNSKTKKFGYNITFIKDDKIINTISESSNEKDVTRNAIIAEVLAAQNALNIALDMGEENICIYYDYEGIEKWAIGEWKANKDYAKNYAEKIQEYSEKINISFKKSSSIKNSPIKEQSIKLAKEYSK